jgi:hypothetical protein
MTSEYVREGIDRATEYTQDVTDRVGEQISELADRAGHRIAELTGRPPEAWARSLQKFLEQSPLKALVIAVAVGYVFGRLVRRD